MSNARNLANLLGAGTTIATASIADSAITDAGKIGDNINGKITLDGSSVATVTVNSAVSSSATIVVDGVSGTIAVGMVVNVSDTTVRSISDASSETAVSVDDTLTITAVASQTSFTVSEAVSIADNVVLILRADENSKMALDASAASTDVGDEILFEDATNDGSITTDNFSTNTGINFTGFLTNTINGRAGFGGVTTNLVKGLAKAWITFGDAVLGNANTGTPAIYESFNISSLTDEAQGDATYAYSSNMAVAKGYIVSGTFAHSADITAYVFQPQPKQHNSVATNTLRVVQNYADSNSAGVWNDAAYVSNSMTGDLA